MIASVLEFVLSNFTLSFFVIAMVAASISLSFKEKPLRKAQIVEAIFSYFLLFCIGCNFFYNFVMHVFFAEAAAKFIGWANSPFQYEVGYASLGFAVVGFLAFKQKLPFRAAAVIAPSLFTLGAAVGHVYQMISAHNFSPGNAGIIFWTDILFPILSFTLLYQQYKLEKQGEQP